MDMQRWEYKIITIKRVRSGGLLSATIEWDSKINIEDELQNLGENGWELVSIVPVADFANTGSGYTHELRYVFKRPK